MSLETTWGMILVLPYVVFFLVFVVWPVVYGLWLGSDAAELQNALLATRSSPAPPSTPSCSWASASTSSSSWPCSCPASSPCTRPWIRWLSVIFILPWAVPSIPTIFSFRWMLNSEWGMLNGILWDLFGIEGPWWLVRARSSPSAR